MNLWTTTPPTETGPFWWLPDGADPADAVIYEVWSAVGTIFVDLLYAPQGVRAVHSREVSKIEGGRWARAVAPA